VGVQAPERRLVGRSRELAKLADARGRAETGIPSVVVIAGEAGIGKSALVEAYLDQAAGTATTLLAHCLPEGSGSYPFGPFVEMLRTLITSTDPGRLPALLGPARGEFSRLLPELADRIGAAAGPARLESPVPVHLYELVLGTVERLARNGLLIVAIEDLQWADDASRDLLAFLLRAVHRGRILLLLTLRTEAPAGAGPVVAWLAELERSDRVQRIDLGSLGRTDLRALLALDEPDADPDLVGRVIAKADGNPFYARQLLAFGREAPSMPLPPILRDVVLARLASVGPRTQRLLRVAALGGGIVDERLLAAVIRASPDDVMADLHEAIRHGLLAVEPGGDGRASGVRLAHVLFQDAIAADLLPAERRAIHEAYAQAIDADPSLAGTPAAATVELARHWDAAERPDRALRATLDAADAAADVGAHGEAARLYLRAVELADESAQDDATGMPVALVDLLQRAAEASSLAGRFDDAVRVGRRALAVAESGGSPAERGLLAERLRWYQWASGDVASALRGAEAAVAALPADVPSALRSRALTHQAGILMFSGRFDDSRPIAEEALATARAIGALPEAAIALGVLAWDEAAGGAAEAGVGHLREALGVAELVDKHEGIALGHVNLAALLEVTGRTADALAEAEAGIAAVDTLGFGETYAGVLHATASAAAFDLGRWDAAEQHAQLALDARAPADDQVWIQLAAARMALGRGRFDDARLHLEAARILAQRPSAARHRSDVTALLAALDLAAGDVATALTRLEP
jgi:tetratricopeptide (TPR) repeat protein